MPVNYIINEIQAINISKSTPMTDKNSEEDQQKYLKEINQTIICLAFNKAMAEIFNELGKSAINTSAEIDMDALDRARISSKKHC